jgi:hypothetical protein
VEQEYCGRYLGSFESEEIGGALVAARANFASGVVPELIGGRLSEEVRFGGEDLSIEELGFNGVVNTFDIGIGIGTGGRVEPMLGAEGLLNGEVKALGSVVDGAAVKFRDQVGSDNGLASIDAMLLEVFEEALDAQGGVGFREFVAVGQELGTTGEFANGVLEAGQAVALHLGPIEGDVGEVLHIHLEAGERGIGGFNGTQVVLTVVSALGWPGQVMGVNDALGGVMAQRQIKFLDEAPSAKTG